MERQSHTEVIRAPLESCFDTIVNFERYPGWFSGIETARIVEADAGAGSWTVVYTLSMIIKTITYTLAYQSSRPHSLTWKMVEGDVTDVEGSYDLKQLEDGITEATCTQGIDIGFWIPGPLKRTFERSALSDSVREFKAAAESREA